MSDLFAPATPPYADFRLFEAPDGSVTRWVAARSLEEAKRLLDLNSWFSGWAAELDLDEAFLESPSASGVFLRFRRGYVGPPLATVIYARPGTLMPAQQRLPDDPGIGVEGGPPPRHYDRAPSIHRR